MLRRKFQEWAHELATGGMNPTRINTCSHEIQDIDQLAIDAIDIDGLGYFK